MTATTDEVEAAREEMIRQLVELKAILSPEVEAAVRAVPRHLFIPEVPVAQAYAPEESPVTKRDEHGIAISSVSASRVQALMLEQAQIRPGMNVLEIGSGGYNAALIAELVGPEGRTTSIDIDQDVTDRARRCLDAAGYQQVNVVRVDGEEGEPQHAPYDRIVVTVQTADIPPAWTGQLAEGGRIVVPLRLQGLTRSLALDLVGGHLVSRNYELCGFVPMQGAGENRMRSVLLHDAPGEEVGLRFDGVTPNDGQVKELSAALTPPRAEVWSGVRIGGMESLDNLDLWLASVLPGFALLTAARGARESGIVASSSPIGTPATVRGGSLAYRMSRPLDEDRTLFELGACGHGPDAKALAEQVAEQIKTWDREHRTDRATFGVYPVGSTDVVPPSADLVVTRAHTRTTISWPSHA